MTSWSQGYVSDIEYLPGFYADQAPGHLQLACLIKGYEPPLSSQSFTYCELGCGQGATANIIAAANPLAHVVAIDFNPAHISGARRSAREFGLTNIEFIEMSFDELTNNKTLKDFDIVSLHGVWSWISQKDRVSIVDFLKIGVKPGGLVALSYNAMPGRAPTLPLQRMIMEHSNQSKNRSDKRVVESLDFIEKLQSLGCQSFGDKNLFDHFRLNKNMRAREDHAIYLAHEYMNEHWQPLYHADTARMLENAKLNFVASATLLENFSDLMLTPEQNEIVNAQPSSIMRETIKDYFVNRPFRRDVFIRGAQSISDSRRDHLLGDMGLALFVTKSGVKLKINTPAGEAQLPDYQYHPIIEALEDRPCLLSEIHHYLKQKNIEKLPSLVEIAGILIGTGQAILLPWGLNNRANYIAHSFNRKAIVSVILRERSFATLTSTLSCSGINFNAMEATIFQLLCSGVERDELAKQALELLSRDQISIDGEIINDPLEIQSRLKDDVMWCINKRAPLWKQLQLL
jgi:hypothetical protein